MDTLWHKPKTENKKPDTPKSTKTKKKKIMRFVKISVILFIFVFTVITVFSSQVLVSNQSHTSWLLRLPLIKQIRHLAESADRSLKGENEDRINILLLGMGGKNHEGGYLTDTIILASLEPTTKKIALISIPRDMAVPVENLGLRKINHINALAEVESKGGGGIAISQTVSDILNIPIDYYLRIDFAGFINIVDELGGLDIHVENTLNDFEYPVMGKETAEDYASRFEHLYMERGWHKMDGSTALKYVRSRHSPGIEGSDFARARRQQKVITAIKENMLSAKNLLKPKMITNIIGELNDHISTNIKIWEIIKLWDNFKDIDSANITNKVLDNSPNGLLVDIISPEGAYLLMPRSGDFSEIEYYVKNIFTEAPLELKSNITKERATVEVRNGTWINGLASQTALDLEKYGFVIVRIGNSSRQNFQKSVIYDLTYGEKTKSLSILKEKTAANVSFGLPQWLIDDISNELTKEKSPIQPDFILIIGQDADVTDSGEDNIENTPEEL